MQCGYCLCNRKPGKLYERLHLGVQPREHPVRSVHVLLLGSKRESVPDAAIYLRQYDVSGQQTRDLLPFQSGKSECGNLYGENHVELSGIGSRQYKRESHRQSVEAFIFPACQRDMLFWNRSMQPESLYSYSYSLRSGK